MLSSHPLHTFKLHFFQGLLQFVQLVCQIVDLPFVLLLHVPEVGEGVALCLELLDDLVDICDACGLFDLVHGFLEPL